MANPFGGGGSSSSSSSTATNTTTVNSTVNLSVDTEPLSVALKDLTAKQAETTEKSTAAIAGVADSIAAKVGEAIKGFKDSMDKEGQAQLLIAGLTAAALVLKK